MEPIQISLNFYSFISATVALVGMAGFLYLLRFGQKTPATWYLIGAVGCIPLAMLALWVTTSVVVWGGAFWFSSDMFAALSMAAMVQFVYHIPEKTRSFEACAVTLFSAGLSLIALLFNAGFIYQILVNHAYDTHIPPLCAFLTPLAFLTALAAAVRRTIAVQHLTTPAVSPWAAAYLALTQPQGVARILRDYSVALSLGLIQGSVMLLTVLQWIAAPWDGYATGFALLIMLVAVIYSTLEYTTPYTGLSVKLVGISLVLIVTVLGCVGLLNIRAAMQQGERERALYVEMVRHALPHPQSALPEAVMYIVAWTPKARTGESARLLYAQEAAFALAPLVAENRWRRSGASVPPPFWSYSTEGLLAENDPPVILRYASYPQGHSYRYVGYVFAENGVEYEVGFSLAAAERRVHEAVQEMLVVVLLSSAFIILGLPQLLRANLVRPLNRLLAGVRQINAGHLAIAVPILYQDEIGFLTQSFNLMAVSLRTEIEERQRAEAQIKALNLNLEQQVLDRTRDLAALYAVSAIAGRSSGTAALLHESLAQTVATMQAEAGLIALVREAAAPALSALAAPDFPPGTLARLRAWLSERAVMEWMLASPAAVLTPNAAADARLPADIGDSYSLTLLLTPMQIGAEALGVICLARRAGHTFNVEDVALLTSIADHLGLAVHSDRLRQQAAVLEERQRIGRDLHDAITQSLYGLVTLTEAGQLQLETGAADGLGHTLGLIGAATRQVLKELRLFIYQLRPLELEQEGLVSAIHQRLAAVEGRANVRARLLADEVLHLSPPVEAALYQITREALNNTLRHARADAVTVTLHQEGESVQLEIVDDGCGFDLAALPVGGMGLANMQARAHEIGGQLEIVTQPGQGTRVKVVVQ